MKAWHLALIPVILALAVAVIAPRPLATFFIESSEKLCASPEAVTAIVWDFRGYDTLFETTVFFIAIAGVVFLARTYDLKVEPLDTPVARAVAKVILPVAIIVALAIAFHGHLTPGGGFQAGTTVAIAAFVVLASLGFNGFKEARISWYLGLTLLTLGLVVIALTAAIPAFHGGAVLQNQAKSWLAFPGYPANLGFIELGGSLFPLDIGETMVTAGGFLLAASLLSLSRGEEK